MTKQRIQGLEEQVSRLENANAQLSASIQDIQQAASEQMHADGHEKLRLRKQLAESQRMIRALSQPGGLAPAPADMVEEEEVDPEDEDPEPPKPNRKTRRAVKKDS